MKEKAIQEAKDFLQKQHPELYKQLEAHLLRGLTIEAMLEYSSSQLEAKDKEMEEWRSKYIGVTAQLTRLESQLHTANEKLKAGKGFSEEDMVGFSQYTKSQPPNTPSTTLLQNFQSLPKKQPEVKDQPLNK